MGVEKTLTANPFHYRKTVDSVRELADWQGVSVLVARALCPLYEQTLPGFKKKRPFFVKTDKCRNHRLCTETIACPAFLRDDEGVRIDADRCTGCALCAQICPENAILPVSRKEADS